MKYIITSAILQIGVPFPMFEVDINRHEINNILDAVYCEFFYNKSHLPVLSKRLLDMMGITIKS